MAANDPSSLEALVASLEGRRRLVFRRIALHVLRMRWPGSGALAVERACSRSLFDDPDVRHEYFLLLKAVFGSLNADRRDEILGWIEQGPDLESARQRYSGRFGQDAPDGELAQHVKGWQRDRLKFLYADLPPEWQARYREIVTEIGESEFPDFVSSGFRWIGPTSPKSADEIAEMADEEMIATLRDWQPSGKLISPSPEGLAREIEASAGRDPVRFASLALQFASLEPTYIRGLISGLTTAVRAGHSFAWQSVLDLCRWVVSQPRAVTPSRLAALRPDETDRTWGPTRQAVAELLQVGCEARSGEIPPDLREEVWEILAPLTVDPDPTPEYESQYGGSNMHPATMSINTVRGTAMHAVVQYALWVARHQKEAITSLQAFPEVRETLDQRLDPTVEPSLTVRAVYGQWFPALASLDSPWAANNVRRIFGRSEGAGSPGSAGMGCLCGLPQTLQPGIPTASRAICNSCRSARFPRQGQRDGLSGPGGEAVGTPHGTLLAGYAGVRRDRWSASSLLSEG